MTNVIKVLEQNNELYVDSREVAEMIDKNHAHLMRDIRGYVEVLEDSPKLDSRNFFEESTYINSQNKVQPCYLLTKKGCDMVANKMTGEKGILFTATYVDAFHEMEQALKAQPQLTTDSYMIEDPLERAKAWIKEEEQRQQLQMTVTELAPKAEFADAVSESVNTISIGFLAKLLKKNGVDTGRTKLFAWLRSNGYLIKSGKDKNTPTQRALDLGIFDVKETVVINKWGNSVTSKTTSVTGKGQTYFIKKFLGTKEIAL